MAVLAWQVRPSDRIAGASAILLAGFLASRVAGLLRDVVISALFGTSADYDLYIAAFRPVDAIFTLVAGGALASAVVPVFAEYRSAQQPDAVSRLASAVFNLVAAASGVVALLGIAFADFLVPLLGAGFSSGQQTRLAVLLRIMLLQPVFFSTSEVISRFLNVHQHFLFPALAPTLYNVAIIVAALALGPSFGTFGLAVGVVSGALVYLLVQLPPAVSFGFRWRPVLDLGNPALRRIGRLMLPRMVGQGALQLSLIATTRLATFLPAGSVAALYYAWLLMMLPLGTFAMSVAAAAFPTLAEQAAGGQRTAFAITARRTLGTILFLTVPSALGLMVAGLPLVQTLFQRGAFTLESSAATAVALAFYAAGLPAHSAIEILARSFYALQNTRTPVVVGVATAAANVLLASVMVGHLGHLGIALAMTLSVTVEAAGLALLLRRQLPVVFDRELVGSISRTSLAAAALAAATWLCLAAARASGLPPLIQTIVAVVAGGTVYLATAFLLHSPDMAAVVQQVRRRLGRPLSASG